MLFGAPGIGKTALLDSVVDGAPEFRKARVAGVESEMELAHAGLHRLLQPFLNHLDEIPSPQAHALRRAFALLDGPPPDRFLVGLATLSLLGQAATAGPLLCVIDDAQWLDVLSRDALALAARRLHADQVAMLFALRDSSDLDTRLDGLPAMHLTELPADAATALVQQVVPELRDALLVQRVVDETMGCPLAIVELSRLTLDELTKTVAGSAPLALPKRLESHFLGRFERLPADTRTLLLIAAAESSGDLDAILSAACDLGIPGDAADAALDAGLIVFEPKQFFRHPLVRSAVYGSASIVERRHVHAALARSVPAECQRRAWHLAAAAAGSDEAVAVGLERLADDARGRGALSTAGVILARAAELTPDAPRRAARILSAATLHLLGGAPRRARSLLDSSESILTDPLTSARAMHLRGSIHSALGEAAEAVPVLLAAARSLRPFDAASARATLLRAVAAARLAGRFAAPGAAERDVALEVRATPLPAGASVSAADLLLDGYAALVLEGPDGAVPILHESLRRLMAGDCTGEDLLVWLSIGCWAAGAIAADDALHALASRLVEQARHDGALVELVSGLLYLAMSELLSGDLDRSRALFAERAEILTTLGIAVDVGDTVVRAWAGDEVGARAAIASVEAYASAHRQGWMLLFTEYALGVLELGLGNYDAAFVAASQGYEDDSFLVVVGYPNMIEAAVRSDHFDDARAAFGVYSARAAMIGTPLSHGMRARTGALLSEDASAASSYEDAIERLASSRAELQLARAHLLYGEWLRRQHRRLDAREHLRTAQQLFESKGIEGYAERARSELAATGERVRRRDVSTARALTPQERRIAELAAQGATNAEIASKLYLSAHTVDYHLRKVFQKLAVTSRRHLGTALVADAPEVRH
ncbi:MAG: LuxR family transcriptional regulator [Acidimicrobiales bacterium]|nr:LuxR family transcriptional regulator [Acidimicrobiales bacterium]